MRAILTSEKSAITNRYGTFTHFRGFLVYVNPPSHLQDHIERGHGHGQDVMIEAIYTTGTRALGISLTVADAHKLIAALQAEMEGR